MGFKPRSSNPVVYSGANYNNSNTNNGLSYFNQNNASNTNSNIGGRHLSQRKSLLESHYPHLLVKNISNEVRVSRFILEIP